MLEPKMSENQTKLKSGPLEFNFENSQQASSMKEQKFFFPQSQEYQKRFMKTALQRHCAYFDRDGDGVITLRDTFRSIRALGFNVIISVIGTLFIHLTMSYQTSPTWIPSIRMPIYLDRIHRCQHGSTTKAYDFIGNIVSYPAVENVFIQFDPARQGGVNYIQLLWMLWNLRDSFDPFGWVLSLFWWTGLYLMAANPVSGILSFESMISQYDGSLFYMIEQQQQKQSMKKYF